MNKIEQLIEKYKNDIVCAEYKKTQALKNNDNKELLKIITEIHNKEIFISDLQPIQDTTEKKCFYCEENKCNCEQQELIERHIADDTTEDVESICPHCGYATIPLKVNKPSDPYGKTSQRYHRGENGISTKEYNNCLMRNGMIGYEQMKQLLQSKQLRID